MDLVLVGSLLAAGNQLRATTQMLEVPGGALVFSQSVQSPVGDVFRLQDELTERIVESLSPSLSGREGAKRRNVPASARAYEFYLRANEVLRDWTQAHVARDLYGECLAADPGFAPAWAKLGRSHRLIAKYHLEETDANLEKGEAALRRALELDPDLPIAHKVLAYHEAEHGRAIQAMARLLGLARRNRNDPEAFAGLVHACRYSGLLEASEAAHREVRRLDPHMPTSVRFTWWAKSDFDSLLAEEAAEGGADFELRVLALLIKGRTEDAREVLRAAGSRRLSPILEAMWKGFGELVERRGGALRNLNALVGHRDPEALLMLATCQAYVGDEGALATLTQAVERGYHVPAVLRSHPWLSELRREGRLDAILEQAEAGRREASRVFDENRGQELLGPI